MKEFYAIARWQMKLPDVVSGVAGGVIMPSGLPLHTIQRRDLAKKYPHLARRLFDPQMYLAELNPTTSRNVCSNLSTYPWFPLSKEPKDHAYDSGKVTQKEWKEKILGKIHKLWSGKLHQSATAVPEAIRLCIDLQKNLGVEALILPAPLTSDMYSNLEPELEWLETGLELAGKIAPELPVYASVILSDRALRTVDPWSNALLDTVLDQVSARGVSRVYLVLEQAGEEGYYCNNHNTVGSLLRLCNGFKRAGAERVLVGYAGTAGLMALGAGADAWFTGWHRSERRLKLADFEDQEGRTMPAYYSHPMGGEFHMERDLDNAVKARLLSRLRDETVVSKGLLAALAAGKSCNTVVEWQNRMGNKIASIEHFLLACVRETKKVSPSSQSQIETVTKAWIDSAAKLADDVYSIGALKSRTAVRHQLGWQRAFEDYEKNKV